jgi:hypothetical protein
MTGFKRSPPSTALTTPALNMSESGCGPSGADHQAPRHWRDTSRESLKSCDQLVIALIDAALPRALILNHQNRLVLWRATCSIDRNIGQADR